MLYGAEIWTDALKKERYRKRMAAVQVRGSMRTAPSYCTVSEPGALVIAGVIPIEILAREKKETFEKAAEGDKKAVKKEAKIHTVGRWQQQ